MPRLKYRTRNGDTPQGKPRVYFCCHPKDFERYFIAISDEILETQNCAIWYTDEFVHPNDLLEDLKQMQLFVMPVTTNLLCTHNEALDIEFKFAIEHHIPVLPLMQEDGLEELFSKKCGDLQFLRKDSLDITAIRYEDKLKKYLDSVLIGDELAEKIRAAFDAYVFLSYRKKDRKHAKELMRLIHKNDFCRDIAIWYDEFLVPGEDFNTSIKEALKKSDLFVLAVTPNLVNETNYVMTTEYPLARRDGKPILAAELVPTDKGLLFEKYADIPNPADAHNEAEFSDALLESIQKMAIQENDASPEHNFFIGLAYLGGIDVEVDYNRAISLITDAAENGLTEAVKQLVSMYRSGCGVQRDYPTAAEWQSKLVEKLKGQYESTKDEDDFLDYRSELVTLGDLYCMSGNLSDAEKNYSLLLELPAYTDSTNLKKDILNQGYYKLGNVCKEGGNLTKAKYYYQKSLESHNSFWNSDVLDQLDSAFTYINIGHLTDDTSYYKNALDIANSLRNATVEDSAVTDILAAGIPLLQSVAHDGLGNALRAGGEIAEAITHYREALVVNEHLLGGKFNIARDKRNRVVTLTNLADALERNEQYDESFSCYTECLKLAEDLAEETETVDGKNILARCYSNLADAHRFGAELGTKEMLKSRKEYHLKSAAILEQLAQNVETAVCHSQLTTSYVDIAHDYRIEGNENEAVVYFQKALHICGRFEGNELFAGIKPVIEQDIHSKHRLTYFYIGMMSKIERILDRFIAWLDSK